MIDWGIWEITNIKMSKSNDIIDLTNSFTLADHCGLSNIVIDLLDTDDSLCIETDSLNDSVPHSRAASKKNVKPTIRPTPPTAADIAKKKIKKQKSSSLWVQRKSDAASPISEKKNKFGGCPICWDELGKNPLASTKCGHVYCIKCIQEYLKVEKKCPTCRQSLKGSTPFHPLYLSRE